MREIKFRVWDNENLEFSNYTNRDPFFNVSHGQIFFWERTQKEDGNYGEDIILEDLGNRFIIQQFTGLKDVNGVDIYEGDIVEWQELDFGQGDCRYREPVTFDHGVFWVDLPLYEVNKVCKIVGNIFEDKNYPNNI